MRFEVLIVDDLHSRRKSSYERFITRCAKELGVDIVPTFVHRPNELLRLVQASRFDVIILDAVLNEGDGWSGFTATEAMGQIGDLTPVALVSGQWDETNSSQITDVFKSQNCRTFMHWRDIDDLAGSGQIDYAIRSFGKLLFESAELEPGLKLENHESIWILHLSDVQSGGFEDDQLRLETRRCAEAVLAATGSAGPTFIAFTGDVAEFGNPDQYADASLWIADFARQLGITALPSRRILYVPGNHDINLSLAAASRLKFSTSKARPPSAVQLGKFSLAKTPLQSALIEYGLAPYCKFHDSIAHRDNFIGDKGKWPSSWIEGRFRHLGVVFYGTNTAQPISPSGLPGRDINPNVLADISDGLNDVLADQGESKCVVIGLGHHCPVSASDDSGVSNPAVFKKFFGSAVPTALFLHGHVHEHTLVDSSDPKRLVRSCATTLTKKAWSRPEDSLRGFNLLELTRENGRITGLNGACYSWLGSELKITKLESWGWNNTGRFRVLG